MGTKVKFKSGLLTKIEGNQAPAKAAGTLYFANNTTGSVGTNVQTIGRLYYDIDNNTRLLIGAGDAMYTTSLLDAGANKLYLVGAPEGSKGNGSGQTYSTNKVYVENGAVNATSFVGNLNNSLTIGNKVFNNSDNVVIDATDLNIANPMTYKGVTTTNIVTNPSASTIIIDGKVVTSVPGYVVLYNDYEYIFGGEPPTWTQLGYATSFAMHNHAHGNIDNAGRLTDKSSVVVTDSTGSIVGGPIYTVSGSGASATYDFGIDINGAAKKLKDAPVVS